MPNSRFQILPLLENLKLIYFWGVVCLLFVRHRPSVSRLVGWLVGRKGDLRIVEWGILGDLGDLPDNIVDLPDIMVDLPDIMEYLPDTMVYLHDTMVDLPDTMEDLPDIMLYLPDRLGKKQTP